MMREGERLTFDSLRELASWLKETPRLSNAGDASETSPPTSSWDLGVGYDGTMAIAEGGGYWPKGAAMVRKGIATAAEMVTRKAQPEIGLSVAGFAPCVPSYLAGVPENMLTMGGDDIVSQSPIITIGVPNAQGSVEGGAIMNRGIAIVTLVDALEAQGYRVEVHTALGCTSTYGGTVLCDATVIIKQANEPWNPNAMAFGMGHPALIRRLGFAVRERCKGSELETIHGYGMGAPVNTDRYTVPLPWLKKNWTLVEALRSVEKLANKCGLNVTLLDK